MSQSERKLVPTPHIEAGDKAFAQTVLMPGDPLRAKFIAETFLEKPVMVNGVRGMLGFTGVYKDKKISVMGSGMGQPSIGIYSYELFKFYGVENIIRVGSCGAYSAKLNVYDVLVASAAYSDTTYAKMQNGSGDNFAFPSKHLNDTIMEAAKELEIPVLPQKIYSSDVFYMESGLAKAHIKRMNDMGIGAVEMESFALFTNANILGKAAACILTVSDSLVTGQETTSAERQKAFTNMMKIALETALNI
jgi:purine-nucleoside phosphorylase